MTAAARTVICALLVAAGAPRAARAQSAIGRVLESETHRRLGGVEVTLVDTAGRGVAHATTDSTGVFYLDAPAPGRYALNFWWSGTTLRTPARDLAAGQEVQAEYFLAPQPETSPARADSAPERAYFEFMVARPVRPLYGPTPHYPDGARAVGTESKLLVQFVVDTTGLVRMSTLRVLLSGGPAFDRAVREVLPRWRFEPARLANGRKVPQVVQLPFEFGLLAPPPCVSDASRRSLPRCTP